MPEANDPVHLAPAPGASLRAVATARAPVLAVEIARLDALVAQQASDALDFFDTPADFRIALIALA